MGGGKEEVGGGNDDCGWHRKEDSGWREPSFSYQSLIPACACTPRYEKLELWVGSANWHGGFCHAPTRPQRGTSPRTTLALGRLSPISRLTCCRAGFVRGFPPPRERQLRGLVGFEVTIQGG